MIVKEKKYSKKSRNLTAGIANIGSDPGRIEQNKKKILDALNIFTQKKTNLIIFPEYCITGYFWEPEKECRAIIDQNGCLEQLAGWLDMIAQTYVNETLQYIIFNALSKSRKVDGHYFNTTIVLDRSGKHFDTDRSYRKRFLPGIEKQYITPHQGDTLVLDTEWGRFGFLTCYDICFPNPFCEIAQEKKVDGIIVNAAWRKEGKREYKGLNIREDAYYQVQWDIMIQALAGKNQAWVLAANAVGPHAIEGMNYCGGSGVWAPSGINTIKASDVEDELLILHNIDIKKEIKKEREDFCFVDDISFVHQYIDF